MLDIVNKLIGKEILVLKVLLSGSTYDEIKIHEADEPEELAASFSRKHKLNKEQTQKLEMLIEQQIDMLVEKEVNTIRERSVSRRSRTPGTPYTHRHNANKAKMNVIKSQIWAIQRKSNDILIEHQKEEKFRMIFNSFNPGRDGQVSAGTISKIDFTLPIFQIIMPVVKDIQINKKIINYKQFKTKMENLFQKLTEEEQNIILSADNRWNNPIQHKIKRF